MQKRREVPAALSQLAHAQAGVVSGEQARGLGLTDRVIEQLITEERWRPITRGIYLTVPVEPSWDSLCWAGLLIGGERARLGPRASGYLHQLLPDAPQPVDVLVPVGRSHRVEGPWQFSRERVGARSARTVGSPPRLTVEDTVLDLCAADSPSEVVNLLTRAAQTRIARPQRLRTALENRARLGLPYCSDVGYEAFQLLVELDGRIGHDGTGRFRDLHRDNRFATQAWLTLRYGWYDVVHRPCLVAFQVASVLINRGWSGLPSRCFRCAAVPEHELAG